MNDSYLLPRSPSRALNSRSLPRHPAGWLWLVLLTTALAGAISSQAQRTDLFHPQPDGEVNALAVQPDGKILVGGDFTHIGGQARNSLGRLLPDGRVDWSFQPAIDANNSDEAVFCLAVQPDGMILVGGRFGSFAGRPMPFLARLYADGSLDPWFWLPYFDGPVRALAVQPDGKIIVVGEFRSPHVGICRLNSDGSLDTTFNPSASSQINCMTVQPDGKILLGGLFTTLNGQTRNYLGRLNADGTLDDSFNPNANGEVHALLVEPDGKIVVGGEFTQIGGLNRSRVARLEASGNVETWSYTGYLTGADGPVRSLALQADGRVLVGGSFNTLGGQNCDAGLGRLMTDGTIDFSFNLPNDIGSVTSLALQPDGNILVAGSLWYPAHLGDAEELVRVENTTPATQSLSFLNSTITWLRGGTSPEVWRTTFESSTDSVNWTPLGAGTRIPGGWELAGVSLPGGANVRARGWVMGGNGYRNGSVWFAESVMGPPIIMTQPASHSVCPGAGQGSTFSVTAAGTGPFTYQWRKDAVNVADSGSFQGVTTPDTPTVRPQRGDGRGLQRGRRQRLRQRDQRRGHADRHHVAFRPHPAWQPDAESG